MFKFRHPAQDQAAADRIANDVAALCRKHGVTIDRSDPATDFGIAINRLEGAELDDVELAIAALARCEALSRDEYLLWVARYHRALQG